MSLNSTGTVLDAKDLFQDNPDPDQVNSLLEEFESGSYQVV